MDPGAPLMRDGANLGEGIANPGVELAGLRNHDGRAGDLFEGLLQGTRVHSS